MSQYEETEWRPIESYPSSNPKVDLWFKNGGRLTDCWRFKDNWVYDDHFQELSFLIDQNPTHFLTITPPQEQEYGTS